MALTLFLRLSCGVSLKRSLSVVTTLSEAVKMIDEARRDGRMIQCWSGDSKMRYVNPHFIVEIGEQQS
jgi:hypothetical protein